MVNFVSMFVRTLFFRGILLMLTITSCTNDPKPAHHSETPKLLTNIYANFNSDSAYQYIEKQVSFGFRIPGTPEHLNCANWLFSELQRHGTNAQIQKGQAVTFDGKKIPVYNIIGSIHPQAKRRILFAAHWDTRPFADQDPNNQKEPILGANDGASGVGVLLELARNLKDQPADSSIGIDFIFFDAEDWGKSEVENSFCLGSQYWAKNPHQQNYTANFGVLLDMVGDKNAQFLWEGNSNEWGNFALAHIWTIGQELGHSNHFITQTTGSIIDDHFYVYQGTKIPMIDIIDYNSQRGFPDSWHTQSDNIENIDKNTLKAVGSTLENLVHNPPTSIFY